MICIHHNKDLDGFTSGAIIQRKYPDCKLIGWDYKDPIPDFLYNKFEGEDIIMIDITFPLKTMIELGNICNLTVIDHHISMKREVDAMEILDPGFLTFVYIYEPNRAACEIGWDYFFPDEEMPSMVQLLGMYDTWRNDDKEVWEKVILPVQYAMRVHCTSPETFPHSYFDESKFKEEYDFICGVGQNIIKYQEQKDMLQCQRSSFERTLDGLRAICLNTTAFSSNTMVSVYDPAKHDVMVGLEYTGKLWAVSLRSSKPDVDVSVIAKARGGGGHKAAAGFEVKNLDEIFG